MGDNWASYKVGEYRRKVKSQGNIVTIYKKKTIKQLIQCINMHKF